MTEMRNNDMNSDNKRSLQESFLEEIRRDLEENPPKGPTPEQLMAMVAKDKAAKRKRNGIIIAAACAAFFLLGVVAFDLFAADVDADKNPKEEIVTEDGVIIEDGGYGSSEWENNIWKTEEWDEVADAQRIYPKLLVPEYIPQEYKFCMLSIETIETGAITAEYSFSNKIGEKIEIEIRIRDSSMGTLSIDNVIKEIESTKGKVYIQSDVNKIATIQIDDGIIVSLWYEIADDEVINIINSLSH